MTGFSGWGMTPSSCPLTSVCVLAGALTHTKEITVINLLKIFISDQLTVLNFRLTRYRVGLLFFFLFFYTQDFANIMKMLRSLIQDGYTALLEHRCRSAAQAFTELLNGLDPQKIKVSSMDCSSDSCSSAPQTGLEEDLGLLSAVGDSFQHGKRVVLPVSVRST